MIGVNIIFMLIYHLTPIILRYFPMRIWNFTQKLQFIIELPYFFPEICKIRFWYSV
jgi:hypothetical protein